MGPACAARLRSDSRSVSPDLRMSAAVTLENGTSSMSSTSNCGFADRVTPADLHLRPAPQSERDRDPAGGDVVAKFTAELHDPKLRTA